MSYERWEDYLAGMYSMTRNEELQRAAAELLCDPAQFYEVATEMLREWPNAARHNLHYLWSGRNAWIGQASCNYSTGATKADTTAAWGTLTNSQQRAANAVAVQVRTNWERRWRDAQTTLAI
jgi:hypothetical protein